MSEEEKNELFILFRLWKSDALLSGEIVRFEYLLDKLMLNRSVLKDLQSDNTSTTYDDIPF